MIRQEYAKIVDERLTELLADCGAYARLSEAMTYSVQAGGKRVRPVLHLMSCAMLGGDLSESLDTACALEMIHTYSLIHDDLPSMDNDDLRRGNPTNHVVYGEGMAVLAGDALLNYAVQVAVKNALSHPEHMDRHLRALDEIVSGSGTEGMLSGQAADIDLEGRSLSREDLDYIHSRKTGALISAAAVSGAILGGALEEEIAALRLFGAEVGLSFQIIDDVLDAEGNTHLLGKHAGKDSKAGKTTFVTIYGASRSKQLAKDSTERACEALSRFGDRARPLREFAAQIVSRDR